MSPTLRFSEVMSGGVDFGAADYRAGAIPLTIRATIAIDDVDRFIADPAHRAIVRGRVELSGFSAPIELGWFELFPDAERGVGRMLYRLCFRDRQGAPLTLSGLKKVRNDPGFDAWRDTTTLFVKLLPGHVQDDSGNPLALGIARITLPGFIRQLTTFRSTGGSLLGEVGAMAPIRVWLRRA